MDDAVVAAAARVEGSEDVVVPRPDADAEVEGSADSRDGNEDSLKDNVRSPSDNEDSPNDSNTLQFHEGVEELVCPNCR